LETAVFLHIVVSADAAEEEEVVETERAVVSAACVKAFGRKALVVWKALVVTSWIATLQALIGWKHGCCFCCWGVGYSLY